jgi:hypothetical protein
MGELHHQRAESEIFGSLIEAAMADGQDEKFDEKEHEKREEKSPEEKSWEEKYRRDPLSPIIWGLILLWAGFVLLLSNMGMLDSLLRQTNITLTWARHLSQAWPLVMLGAGVILLVEVVIRLVAPIYRRSVIGTVILAILFIGIGLGDLVSWNLLWPLLLIGLGLIIVARGLLRSKGS